MEIPAPFHVVKQTYAGQRKKKQQNKLSMKTKNKQDSPTRQTHRIVHILVLGTHNKIRSLTKFVQLRI